MLVGPRRSLARAESWEVYRLRRPEMVAGAKFRACQAPAQTRHAMSAMAEIIVTLERGKILNYLRSAIRPEIETQYEDALAQIEELQAELDEARDQIEHGPEDW